MMGTKARLFRPVCASSLDALVPADHFYRHVDRVLDLAFVRDLVQDCYIADTGRPSIDPVVFFKLHLVMFFEGIRSERQLLRLAADRLSVRWFLGYNLDEPLPDHSSLTRIRTRYGLDVFRCFFEAIVEQCQQVGLVWGKELYVDATQVQADAALDSLTARFVVEAREQREARVTHETVQASKAVQAHLAALFATGSAVGSAVGDDADDADALRTRAPTEPAPAAATAPPSPGPHDSGPHDSGPHDSEPYDSEPYDSEPYDSEPYDSEPYDSEPYDSEPYDSEPYDQEPREPPLLPVLIAPEQRDHLATANAARHDWIAREGRQQREVHGHYQRTADLRMSTTDADATPLRLKGGGTHLGYHTHYVVDGGKRRIILGVLVTPGEVMENQPMLDLLWRVRFRWKLHPRQVTGDTTYGTLENIQAMEDMGIRAYVPLPDWEHQRPYFGPSKFTYDAERDVYICPQRQLLRPVRREYHAQKTEYRAEPATCNACPLKADCTPSDSGRQVHRHFAERYLERVRAYHRTPAYEKALRKRHVWVEPLFAEAKAWHGLRRFRLRRLWRVNCEALMTAAGQNLKRLLVTRGWGRRPLPSGAALAIPSAGSVLECLVSFRGRS